MQFAAAVNCIDGRTQEPVIHFIKAKYNVKFIDMITEAGPIKELSRQGGSAIADSIKNRIDISIEKHCTKLVAVVGHYDCAGNPVDEEIQREQVRISVQRIKNWNNTIDVIGLWVNSKWCVEEIC